MALCTRSMNGKSPQEERCRKVVKSFISLMNNRSSEHPSYNISNDAVMDWFGRSVCGRASIISFVKPRCQLKVDRVARIPRVSHRLLKHIANIESKKCTVEQENKEDDSGQRTPDNPICPDLEELMRAPKKGRHWTVNATDLEFVEIKGSLRYQRMCFDGTFRTEKKELKKIVLGYSDEIHFIEYVGDKPCRVNLSNLFSNIS